MRKLPKSIWIDFQRSVSGLNDKSSPREVLETVLNWLRNNEEMLSDGPFAAYGFGRFIAMDEHKLPVQHSSMIPSDIPHFRDIILRYNEYDLEPIARFLSDTIEEIVVLQVARPCQNCGFNSMKVYTSSFTGLLAFECSVCGYAEYSNGVKIQSDRLDFADTLTLEAAGLLSASNA
ncbi:hypothetical protein [Rhizobium sp. S163]|uniref:hypothetical protein n=1 Tax=Rhizobium sp. S163 TaxID=3055039 RepID=UPI0025A938F1|nr:hypothetical protein [Rhizobium sp. S163]MDM9645787.1 hypothetical protein [Rhizobium sp. S163]